MKEISVQELKVKLDAQDNFQFIDVREHNEYEIGNIGATHIPMGEVMDNLATLDKDKLTVIMCRSGGRSGAICSALYATGFTNVHNLKGGITAWSKEIDNAVKVG